MLRAPRWRGTVLVLALVIGFAQAQDLAPAEPDSELEAVRDHLAKNMPEIKRENITRSGASGLFELHADHKFGYVTADGRYLVSGDLVDLDTGERITERRRNDERLQTLAKFSDQVIEFAPEPDKVRWWITVFTDIDCEYCRKLHRQVPELNRLGVGVRYLFFSRYGVPSEAYSRAQYVWCAPDRKAALDEGLQSGSVKKVKLCKNPVVEQYLAAVALNLRATPIAIFPDGSTFYGSASAEELLAALQARDAANATKPAAAAAAAVVTP